MYPYFRLYPYFRSTTLVPVVIVVMIVVVIAMVLAIPVVPRDNAIRPRNGHSADGSSRRRHTADDPSVPEPTRSGRH